jgi:hypothetical protein
MSPMFVDHINQGKKIIQQVRYIRQSCMSISYVLQGMVFSNDNRQVFETVPVCDFGPGQSSWPHAFEAPDKRPSNRWTEPEEAEDACSTVR